MVKLAGKRLYLAQLERVDCHVLMEVAEYDFAHRTDRLEIGTSLHAGADQWFDEIQRDHGSRHVRLGVFLENGEVIGDIALQDIDWQDRKCSLGLGFARKEHRGHGYAGEAIALMLSHGFDSLGLRRVEASTLAPNVAAQRSLEKAGFVLEGRQREAVCIGQVWHDKLLYGLLVQDRK